MFNVAQSMMPVASRFLFVILLSITTLPSPAHSRQQTPAKKAKPVPPRLSSHVILISISGLRSDYLSDQYKDELAIPTLRALRDKGARTRGIESVYPSLSRPAHATILTGMLPADHGVTSDYLFDEQTGAQSATPSGSAIRGETIQQAAWRAGLSTAVAGFPLSSEEAITADHSEPAAKTKQSEEQHQQKLSAQALSADQMRAAAAAAIIEKQRPDLLLICLESLDTVHRLHGPLSREAMTVLARIDELVRQLTDACDRAGIGAETTFLIVAPYGSARVENEFSPNVVLAAKKLLTTDGQGRITAWQAIAQPLGGAAAIMVRNQNDDRIISAVEAAFREYYEKPHSPLWRIIPRRDVSRLGADARAILYLDAAPMYVMSGRARGDAKSKTDIRGASGYLPQRFEMRGALIASGRGIRKDAGLEFARLTDLAPTIARLLGFELKATRGRVLSEILMP
jgi:predicted AlkP superfamily pyrophosphatase or phosphodiesterase